MPKVGGRRKKARTHVEEEPEGDEIIGQIPKSLIFRRGKLNKPLKQIVQDFREIMYPYTSMKLKESEKTKIKDYLQASSVYGMTHMTVLTSTENHNYIRFIKNPEGPTITFKIISYCTRRDVVNANKKNKSFSRQFQPAMLILNGFNKESSANVRNPPTLPQQSIVAQMIQSMFPPLSLKNTKLNSLQRVILFSYDNERDLVNMRHYHVSLMPTGVNKNIQQLKMQSQLKKILKQDKKTPNLSKFNSFSDFVQNKKQLSGFASESDADELPDSKIDVEQKSFISGKQSFKKQYSIRLHEIGPRLKLRLYKIEEGLLRGNVVYNRRVVKTSGEIEDQRKEILRKQLEKEKRKKEQEKRIREKERDLKMKEREKAERRRFKEEERQKKAQNGEQLEDEEQEEEEEEQQSDVDLDIDNLEEEEDEENVHQPSQNKSSEGKSTKKATQQKQKKSAGIYEKDEVDSEDELHDLQQELTKIQKQKKNFTLDGEEDEEQDEEDFEDEVDFDEEEEDDDEDDDEIDEDDDVEGDSGDDQDNDDDEEEEEEEEEEVEEKEPKLKKKKKNN